MIFEIELKLPFAEIYTIDLPHIKTGKRKLEEYVKDSLFELQPGFSNESLWDFKVEKKTNKILAVVLERDYYIENCIAEKRASFYIINSQGKKIRFFEKCKFSETGERIQRSVVPFIFLFIILFVCIFAGYKIANKNKKKEPVQEIVKEQVLAPALNFFDVVNAAAKTINEHDGKIKLVRYNATNKGLLEFSIVGCEPYSLINDFLQKEFIADCRCNNVLYSDGKENFELLIDIKLPLIVQKLQDEISLLRLQNHLTEEIQKFSVKLVSTNIENGSGRVSIQLEAEKNELSIINTKINKICIAENLFVSSFTEMKSSASNKFILNISLIQLEDKQIVSDENVQEYLAKVFENEIKKIPAQKNEQAIKSSNKNEVNTYKKIGSIKKEGKSFYYYRTEEGKIIISEVDYE